MAFDIEMLLLSMISDYEQLECLCSISQFPSPPPQKKKKKHTKDVHIYIHI